MNKNKSSGLLRLIAFFLVAIVMVCTFGFAADGWTLAGEGSEQKNDKENPGNVEGVVDKDDAEEETKEPVIYIPEYINALTGIETSEELANKKPLGFVMDASSPLYGVSYSDVLVELPVDNGATRLVGITTDIANLWKLGSLAKTRGYISNIGKFFDSTVISAGNDDTNSYNSCDVSKDSIVFSQENGFCYSEYSYYLYSNVNLVNSALIASNVSMQKNTDKKLPYLFTDFGADEILGEKEATSISVFYSSGSMVELNYIGESGEYEIVRNGNRQTDLLNNEELNFKNCLILFSDSVTYEGTEGSQTVMNTIGEGVGFYFTNGTASEIKWQSDIDGNLTLTDLNGSTLTLNRGRIYIGFVKSSRPENVSFS